MVRMVHLPTEGTEWTAGSLLISQDGRGLQPWDKGIPPQGWIRGCLLAEGTVIIQPPHTPMTLSLLGQEPCVSELVASGWISGLHGHIPQKTVGNDDTSRRRGRVAPSM